ncbi:hypothetical protein BC834DRAFT_196378 [Gloeopeniophorella convolvens]|nr:hypothetical protein BC834DRAFT_196378 [Gloeopeniophorella convolvens]
MAHQASNTQRRGAPQQSRAAVHDSSNEGSGSETDAVTTTEESESESSAHESRAAQVVKKIAVQIPDTDSSEASESESESESDIIDVSDLEAELLDSEPHGIDDGDAEGHDLKTAPLFTREAYLTGGLIKHIGQYGVFGQVVNPRSSPSGDAPDPDKTRIYVNTNAPFSAVVCGVQGSGKSHTVSVLLESMFIPQFAPLGSLKKPLSGLVLHYGETGASARPCEAAFLGLARPDVTPPPVRVYVAPSSFKRMQVLYKPLGKNVQVRPLYFSESELDVAAFLSMMAVSTSESVPLYIHTVMSVLRELGDNFNYTAFMRQLEEKKKDMNPAQTIHLEQRLELLHTFTQPAQRFGNGSKSASSNDVPRFARGQITILDLSDQFIDAPRACGLFEICVRLFERADVQTGKVLLVDEAHKYLSPNKTAGGLTGALLSLIRQQRHLSMRVIVSTQEPTVLPPVFVDLCSIAILHRFSSSAWWDHLSRHVSADISGEEAFDKVVKLKTGEAMVLAPSGLYMKHAKPDTPAVDADTKEEKVAEGAGKAQEVPESVLTRFGRRFFIIKTRRRVTADGGASLLAVDK